MDVISTQHGGLGVISHGFRTIPAHPFKMSNSRRTQNFKMDIPLYNPALLYLLIVIISTQ